MSNETPFPTADSVSSAKGAVKDFADQGDATLDTGAAAAHEKLDKASEGAHAVIERLAETAIPAVQRLQEGVQAAADALSQSTEGARKISGEWTETLRCTVRDNPLAAVATALAVGLLVARLAR